LEGAINYKSWKKRIDLIIEKNKILDVVRGKVKKPTKESSDANKVKYRELEILAMTLMVEIIKNNLVPYISNIEHAQEIYEALTKLFTIKNIGQVVSLKNELRTTKMTKDDIVASFFVRISRIRDELQAIDEIVLEELVITPLLGLPPTWSSFASGLNSWKDYLRTIMECLSPRRNENFFSIQQRRRKAPKYILYFSQERTFQEVKRAKKEG